MKELYTEIEIYASDERVWQVLTDFASYSEWNPFISRLEGKPKTGEQLKVSIQPPESGGISFQPTVLKAEPKRELRWLGHLFVRGLFDGEHIFIIEPLSSDRVRFIQREIFTGLLVRLFARQLDINTKRGFEAMNQALKLRAEARV